MSTMVKTECKYDAGIMMPVIDKNKCEAKEKCTAVCPYSVFEIRSLTSEEKKVLPFFIRFKVRAHGNKQAFVVHADQCHACSDCIKACPEKAIKLVKFSN